MTARDEKTAGLDLNGIWDHCVRIVPVGQGESKKEHDDLGARSVVVRAKPASQDDGSKGVLVGGREALESIYGRGEAVFGSVGKLVHRMEVREAWRRVRGEYEPERLRLLRQGSEDEEIAPLEALLAQARAAMGRAAGGSPKFRMAGIVMRDDEASTETVQDEIRKALGWNAMGGTRAVLVWDSVAVAKAALEHCRELRANAEFAVVVSYGKRIRIFPLRVREDDGRRVPVRRRDEGRSGQSAAQGETTEGSARAGGWDIWHEGWDASVDALRTSRDRKTRAVIRQTRQGEEWVQDDRGKAVIGVKDDGRVRWALANRPWTPPMRASGERKIDMGKGWSKVVVWTPMGRKATEALASCIRAPEDQITLAGAEWAAEGAALAALDLGHGRVPWYDRLDRMTIKVERDGEEEDLLLVDEKQSVPAGKAFRTSDEHAREISSNVYMTEDNDSILLKLTKGQGDRKWSQEVEVPLARKPKGRAHVELRARQTPGQGSAELELRSAQYEPWRDAPQVVRFTRETPDQEAVKPALILYEPAKQAWNPEVVPRSLTYAAGMANDERINLNERQLIEIRQWLRKPLGTPPLNKEQAVGTNGRLPDNATGKARRGLENVLKWTEQELLEAITNGNSPRAKKKVAVNALHGVHTWCFAKASPDVLEALIQATEGVGAIRHGLQWDDAGARRAIWHGLGRSVTSRDTIERVLDNALRAAGQDETGTMKCDALAAASHLLARRHIAGLLVLEDGRRAKEAATIACEKICRMSKLIRQRKDGFNFPPGLQLRYAVLLAGGLARVKDMKSECLQCGTETAGKLANTLEEAIGTIDGQDGWNAQKANGLKPIMASLRDVFGKGEQPDSNLLKIILDTRSH